MPCLHAEQGGGAGRAVPAETEFQARWGSWHSMLLVSWRAPVSTWQASSLGASVLVVSAQQCKCRAPLLLESHLHLLLKLAAPCSIIAQLGALVRVNCVTETPQPAREQDHAASRETVARAHLPSTLHGWTFSCRLPPPQETAFNQRCTIVRAGTLKEPWSRRQGRARRCSRRERSCVKGKWKLR